MDITRDDAIRRSEAITTQHSSSEDENIATFLQLFTEERMHSFSKMTHLNRLCVIARLRDKMHELTTLPIRVHYRGWTYVKQKLISEARKANFDITDAKNLLEQNQYHLFYLELGAVKQFTDNEYLEELRKVSLGKERTLDTRLWEVVLLMAGSKNNFPSQFHFSQEIDMYLRDFERKDRTLNIRSMRNKLYSFYFTKDGRPAPVVRKDEDCGICFDVEEVSTFERLIFLGYLNQFKHLKSELRAMQRETKEKPSSQRDENRMSHMGFAIHQVITLWNLVAVSLGFSDVEEMLLPYLHFNIRKRRLVPLSSRQDGFSPKAQQFTLFHGIPTLQGYTTESETSIAHFARRQTEDGDSQLRRGAVLIFEHMDKCLYDLDLYECHTDLSSTEVQKFMLDENDDGYLYPILLNEFRDVKGPQKLPVPQPDGNESDESVQFVAHRRISG